MEVNLNSLTANVGALGVECPWTRRQKTADMLFYLRKELLEVEEELRKPKVDGAALANELGDVLFDALMLIEVTKRDHPAEVNLEACAASACAKLRRRCPYIFGGSPASTVEEAEAAWQSAKRAERERAEAAVIEAAETVVTPVQPASQRAERERAEAAAEEAAAMMTTAAAATMAAHAPNTPAAAAAAVAKAAAKVDALVSMPRALAPAAMLRIQSAFEAAAFEEEDDDEEDETLKEWERDFGRDAGPPSDSEEGDY